MCVSANKKFITVSQVFFFFSLKETDGILKTLKSQCNGISNRFISCCDVHLNEMDYLKGKKK